MRLSLLPILDKKYEVLLYNKENIVLINLYVKFFSIDIMIIIDPFIEYWKLFKR